MLTYHLLGKLPDPGPWAHTPFNRGLEPVLLFFMLSGFVLLLPFMRGPVEVRGFLVRRVCRIWPPYVAALALALAWRVGFPALGGWPLPLPDAATLAGHLLLVGSFDHGALNAVIWSLVHEMRISLAFPLVAWAALHLPTRHVLLGGAVVSVATLACDQLQRLAGGTNDLWLTPHFLLFFLVGAALARHRAELLAGWAALGPAGRGLALAAAAAAYLGAAPLAATPGLPRLAQVLVHDGVAAAGGAVLLLAALAPGAWQAFLALPACRFLGRISYSLYLVHLPVLAALHDQLGLRGAGLAAATLPLAIALAWAGERWVERPAIALGRRLT